MFDSGELQQIVNLSFSHNSLESYAIALLVFLVLLLIFFLLQKIILYKLNQLANKTSTRVDNMLINSVKTLKPPFYTFLAFYSATYFLELNQFLKTVIDAVLVIWIVYQIIKVLLVVVDYVINKKFKRSNGETAESAVSVLKTTIKVLLWIFGFIFILANFGVDVTSFIAGLGIGGIAIALALQNILSDLFSSFAIFFDKPFKVGDFIIVGDKLGTVQKIGIKTTRI